MSCPFYGRAYFPQVACDPPFILLDSHGNECGLVRMAHAPCVLEIEGKEVNWESCPRVDEVLGKL